MSWQDYVDNQLIASHCVAKAAIAGHDGSVWAKSAGFEVGRHFSYIFTRNNRERDCVWRERATFYRPKKHLQLFKIRFVFYCCCCLLLCDSDPICTSCVCCLTLYTATYLYLYRFNEKKASVCAAGCGRRRTHGLDFLISFTSHLTSSSMTPIQKKGVRTI